MSIIGDMNYNATMRDVVGKSNLAKIEEALITAFFRNNGHLNSEALTRFEANLICRKEVMDQPHLYEGLERNGMLFSYLKEQALGQILAQSGKEEEMGKVR